jgi:TRAP-type C4-dicarboxylate transport system permease small subunit
MERSLSKTDTIFRAELCVAKAVLVVTSILFITMLSVMMYQILCRYIFGVPTVWAEELVRYLFIVTTFFGAAVALVWKNHIEIDIMDVLLEAKVKNQATRINMVIIINVFRFLVVAVVMTIITKSGYEYAVTVGSIGDRSPAMKLPMIYVHFLVTFGYMMTVLHSLLRVIESVIYPKDI